MVGWFVTVRGGPSIIYRDHEMMKSIKELVKIRQSVVTLYSDTSTNRHTDGFLQDCNISSALAMEKLQSCVKPWILYQCICGVVCPLFFRIIFLQNIKNPLFAKRTIHGRTLGRLLDSCVAIGDRATVFQQHSKIDPRMMWKKINELIWDKKKNMSRNHCISASSLMIFFHYRKKCLL